MVTVVSRTLLQGHFSEREAADKMKSLVDVIRFAHSKNIIHRDLKPENILLSDATPNAILKVIDFGTSDFCLDGHHLTQKFGTPYYVAPEVLKKHYDKSADIWSAGVILYILLCGYPPFGGKTDARILARVQAGELGVRWGWGWMGLHRLHWRLMFLARALVAALWRPRAAA